MSNHLCQTLKDLFLCGITCVFSISTGQFFLYYWVMFCYLLQYGQKVPFILRLLWLTMASLGNILCSSKQENICHSFYVVSILFYSFFGSLYSLISTKMHYSQLPFCSQTMPTWHLHGALIWNALQTHRPYSALFSSLQNQSLKWRQIEGQKGVKNVCIQNNGPSSASVNILSMDILIPCRIKCPTFFPLLCSRKHLQVRLHRTNRSGLWNI